MSLIRKITVCLLGAGTLLSPAPLVGAEDLKAAGHYVDVGIPQVSGISALAMMHQVHERCRGLLSDVIGTVVAAVPA